MERNKLLNTDNKWYLWLTPLFIILALVYLYPILNVIRMSFTDTRIGSKNYSYTFDSYMSVFTDKGLWKSLYITLIFALGSVIFQIGLGLGIALLINKDLPGAGFVKLSMIVAWVVPGVITGLIWQMMYSNSSWGLLNNILSKFGLKSISFLSIPWLALLCALIANVWRGIGFSGIMQYAAIKAIHIELFESARLDGANEFVIFKNITLPQLKPMFLINLVLITIYSINTYDSIYTLTQGGPGDATTVLPLQSYKAVFTYLSLGKGSVYAVILLVMSLILTVIYIRLMGKED